MQSNDQYSSVMLIRGISSSRGMRRKKHLFRALFRTILLMCLIIFAAIFLFSIGQDEATISRKLNEMETPPCKDLKKVNSLVELLPYTIGVIYMFLAIAIVCDELFVPTLEELASENYMNLSMDVAGATLMAAGGSAPELFTSLIGTFNETEVGFGTIVGSAVFNVLFVIGMCAVFSLETLDLSWYPLARDSFCYSICLCVLALFCGSSSPGRIELWEAIVLFCLYISYVLIMSKNNDFHSWLLQHFTSNKVGVASESEAKDDTLKQSFRIGLMRLLMGKGSVLDRAGMHLITDYPGHAKNIFDAVSKNADGFIGKTELGNMFNLMHFSVKDNEIDDAILELDENGDGKVCFKYLI